jgi:hypothetical protein
LKQRNNQIFIDHLNGLHTELHTELTTYQRRQGLDDILHINNSITETPLIMKIKPQTTYSNLELLRVASKIHHFLKTDTAKLTSDGI